MSNLGAFSAVACCPMRSAPTKRDVLGAAYPKQIKRIVAICHGSHWLNSPARGAPAGDILSNAFIWCSTGEGYDYWSDLSLRGHS